MAHRPAKTRAECAETRARRVSLRNNEYFYPIPLFDSSSAPALPRILIVSRAKIDRSRRNISEGKFPACPGTSLSPSLFLSRFSLEIFSISILTCDACLISETEREIIPRFSMVYIFYIYIKFHLFFSRNFI